MKMNLSGIVCFTLVVILCCIGKTISIDRLHISQSITYNSTITSPKEQFHLGFFSLANSKKFYLGVWFNLTPTRYVWIANRENPLNDTSGVLRIREDGNLVLQDNAERIFWSTNITNSSSQNFVAHLLDSGNFILSDGKEEARVLWQSFDHPSHAMIPGMKFGWDLTTGLNRYLTSWKNLDDPSPGEYTYRLDLHGVPQIFVMKGDLKHYRSGPWNGIDFGGIVFSTSLPFGTQIKIDDSEVYYEHYLLGNSSLMLVSIDHTGVLQIILREKNKNDWRVMLEIPQDFCGDYAYCGPNAICTINDARVCSCIPGYMPTNPWEWNVRIWSGGCVLESPANCSERVHFKEYDGLKMPDLLQFKLNATMTQEECKAECLRNCSCTAYADANSKGGGSGCLLWFGDLIDIRRLTLSASQKLHIRVSAEDIVTKSDSRKKIKIVIAVIVPTSILLICLASIILWKRKSQGKGMLGQEREKENFELPYFDIDIVTRATQNYSNMNKIGEGGFGPVYKGKLESGQEIAIKRLAETSNQGLDEFKNEVMLIAKLQHRNLVRLLGCCIHGDERMLVYEYMPNGSLDSYIFGGSLVNNHLLAWRRRFAIITGICRGLLYLHRDSRLRVIHRDLKASNVLLDSEMNPKISDFGMARTIGEDQLRMKTKRVVGTYGYMAPEYAIDGVYSTKSDVFSLGVLVLEILSGKRNNQFHHPDHDFNLLGHAWRKSL
ncbi:transmembrane signal receptor [Lithospermum erythrorhizon]|uniref:Receptor-like serine/threonine-protein kinase n=1 Tax=Lithospermum erythrorhizon TaxID=34254 RepID=A0AAV3P4T8_LITER